MRNFLRSLKWNTKAFFIKVPESKGKTIVLNYHGIVPNNHLRFNYRFIILKNFEKQIKLISKNFNVISIKDCFENNISSEKLNICLTFDDGYMNNYSLALPILKKYNVKASFFITPIFKEGYKYLWADYIDITSFYINEKVEINNINFYKKNNILVDESGKSLKLYCKETNFEFKKNMFEELKKYDIYLDKNLEYCELMGIKEIEEISNNELFEIGSHGLYHNNLDIIEKSRAVSEMKKSKEYLENVTQKTISSFAYPDGAYNKSLIDECESIGYKYQLLLDKKYSEYDSRVKERFGINPFLYAINQIKYNKLGTYV